MGDPDESIQYFKNAIKINPNYTLAYFNLGRAYQAIGDKAHSAEYYQMALDLNKLTEELDRINILVDMFKIYNIEIPSLFLEKKRIIERILSDNKAKPICKSFSNDELFDIFGIEKPSIQEELDEL